ncbi:MAG: DUF3800 domain-containing protein [Actinomycetia bacterium]|nr:DUF3800 domain-containing protein [Actinomycetes bacterium]
MHILYMDESGIEDLGAGTSHFVLLGLAIPAVQWKSLDAALLGIKSAYGLRDTEIHSGWMHRRYSEQESIAGFEELDSAARRSAAEAAVRKRAGTIGVLSDQKKVKSYRRESRQIRPYLHLTRDERLECLESLARELASWSDVRIFADAISKPDFKPAGPATPYEMAFEQVLTRFQVFLSAVNSTGIVVHDNNATAAPRLTKLARKFHADGTLYRKITHIVETPLFVDSGLTSMIQIADLCSFALRRLLENDEHRLWDIVEPCVDRRHGVSVGVRHYTGSRRCKCCVCLAHGRKPSS